MNPAIYSIERGVIKEFESLKSQIQRLHSGFIKHLVGLFSFYITVSQMAAKRTFAPKIQPIEFLINCLFSLYELSPCYA